MWSDTQFYISKRRITGLHDLESYNEGGGTFVAVKMLQFLFSIKRAQVSDTTTELNLDMIVKEPGGLYFAEELLSTSSCVYECQSNPR